MSSCQGQEHCGLWDCKQRRVLGAGVQQGGGGGGIASHMSGQVTANFSLARECLRPPEEGVS